MNNNADNVVNRRIAMWSGPRNISTAMMRAFENRDDCRVMDEPFYAYYLAETGIDHPMRDEIVARHETDLGRVIASCTAEAPNAIYQKQMCHHMIDGVPLDWIDEVVNCFLIRDPDAVVASYAAKRQQVTAEDLGYRRQAEIHKLAGGGPVLDAADVLASPEDLLRQLCDAVGIPFQPAMLSWPAGIRESDGVWAAHWYGAVARSTGFQRPQRPAIELDLVQQRIADECRPYYETLRAHRLTPRC